MNKSINNAKNAVFRFKNGISSHLININILAKKPGFCRKFDLFYYFRIMYIFSPIIISKQFLMGTKTTLSNQSQNNSPMEQFILLADRLFDNWMQKVRTTQDIKNDPKIIELSNAKAEQVLDDLHLFFTCVKTTAPDVAKHIHLKLKNKLPEIANTMFNPNL